MGRDILDEGTDESNEPQFKRRTLCMQLVAASMFRHVQSLRSSSGLSASRVATGGRWDGSADTAMDIGIVDMTSSSYEGKGAEAFAGMDEGLGKLQEEIADFRGYRLELFQPETAFDGDNSWSDLDAALEQMDLTERQQYHVVYDGSLEKGSFHSVTGETAWGNGRAISGLSMWRTQYSTASAYVRGLHQLLHTYIDGSVAKEVAGFGEQEYNGSEYDATHALGTVKSRNERIRSVMADIYPAATMEGECVGGIMHGSYPPPEGEIHFSRCTKEAIRRTLDSAEQ